MNRRVTYLVAPVLAVLGWWLPSLWLPLTAPRRPLVPALPSAAPPPLHGVPSAVRSARSPLELFQAVLADPANREDLRCQEAEDLARILSAESLARRSAGSEAFLESLKSMEDVEAAVAALRAWSDADPDKALAILLKSPVENIPGAEPALTRLVARDPAKALAMLNSLPGGRQRYDVWHAVLAGCAETDVDPALAAIRSAPPDCQYRGVKSLLTTLAAKDSRAALAFCETMEPGLRHWADPDDVFRIWARTDPAAALQECLGRGGDTMVHTGYELTKIWAHQDPDALFQWALQHPDKAGSSFDTATRVMARRDPQRALIMVQHAPPSHQGQLLWEIGNNWAQQDADASLTWARSLPEERRHYVINGIIPWLTPDAQRSLSADLGLETSPGFGALLAANPDEALQKFPELSPATRAKVFSHIVYELSNRHADFATAAGFVADVMASELPPDPGTEYEAGGARLQENLAELTGRWATLDPAATAAWVEQLPAGDAHTTAAANLALTWGRYDLPAARVWVEQLPAGAAHDKAAEQITRLTKSSGE